MALILGEVTEGTVEKILDYGAFINLPQGKKGLVRISEVTNGYAKNIRDFLKESQKVKVKIIGVSPDAKKIDLSIKQADDLKKPPENPRILKPILLKRNEEIKDKETIEFEDKLAKFMKASEERLTDFKKNLESKRGGNRFKK